MRKEENSNSKRNGISIPVSVIIIAAVSVIIASTAVIVNEGIERAREDDNALHPYFHLYANPSHQNSTIDEWVTYEINLVPHIYLYAPCRLVVLDMYDGVYSSITPNVIYPGDVATLTVKGTVEGEFFREVVGTYNGQTDAVRVTLEVKGDENSKNSGSFKLVADPWTQTTDINVPAYYEISLEIGDDFEGEVDLEVLDCYDGVLSVLKPEKIGANETAVLVLTPLCSGEFTRSITGTNDDFEICIMVSLDVNGDSNSKNSGSFKLVADPWAQTTDVNVPAYYNISLETGDDFQGEVDLEVLDCYDGVISVLNPEKIGANQTAVLVLTPLCPGEFTRSITGTNDDFEICIMVSLLVRDKDCYEG